MLKVGTKARLVCSVEDLNDIFGRIKYDEYQGFEYIEPREPYEYEDKAAYGDTVVIQKMTGVGYDIMIERTGFKMHFLEKDLEPLI